MEVLSKRIELFLDVGDGSGSGNGYGYGSGISEFDGHKVYIIDDIPTCITSLHGNIAEGFIIRSNSIKEPCFIARSGNYFGHGKTAHEAMEAARAKELENGR